MDKLLVQELRGELVECEYEGHICGVSYSGEIKYRFGDPRHVTYMRSAAKPIQAIPAFRHGIAERYPFNDKELIKDEPTRRAVERIGKLMNANAEMVSGTGLICSTLLRDDNIVAKGGAKGIYCFGLRKERLAFALKVMDGSEDKWPIIVASILEQIGYDRQRTIDSLYELCPRQFANGSGTIVGTNKAVFRLETVG